MDSIIYKHICLVCVIIFACCEYSLSVHSVRSQRKPFMHALSDEAYQTYIELLQGCFNVKVQERTKEQKAAIVNFYRRRPQFSLGNEENPTLYFDGRKVIVNFLVLYIL